MPLGRLLIERAVREALAVARARGVDVGPEAEERILGFVGSLPGGLEPSLLADLEAGRPTELGDLCGVIARLGLDAGVETPVHDTAAAALGVGGPPA